MNIKLVFLLGLISLAVFPARSRAQIAPIGNIHVVQPGGIHYFFGSAGSTAGGAFSYINYVNGQYDIIAPVSISPSGSFSATSEVTGRRLSGQVGATSISLSYNGVSVAGPKASAYGPVSNLAGGYSGAITEPNLGVFFTTFVVYPDGVAFLFSVNSNNVSAGVGTVSSNGSFSVRTLIGEVISGTFAPSSGVARGTALSNFGYNYTYGVTKAVPQRLANISTRGFIGTGDQVLIGGFIVKDGGKTILMNAKGPSLAGQGVVGAIQNPRLDLYRNGQVIASNSGWRSNANASEIAASGAGPTNDLEASLQVGLEPGAYTVIVSGENGSQGIGLVEVFGID